MLNIPPMLPNDPPPPDDFNDFSDHSWTLKEFIEHFVTFERDYLTHGSYYIEVDENGQLLNEMSENAEPDLFWTAEFEETQKTWFCCNKCHSECESYSDLQMHLVQYHFKEISNINELYPHFSEKFPQ
jgi:hypothetical protein